MVESVPDAHGVAPEWQEASGEPAVAPVQGHPQAGGPRPGRRWWLASAAAGALLVAGAFWAGTKATSPATLTRRNAPAPRTALTAPVVLRRLTEKVSANGVVEPARMDKVDFGPVNIAGAQPIVTSPPIRQGSVIANGTLVAQIAGRPVYAMLGSTPMYRELTLGDRGADVAQLQDDMAALGFPSSDSSGVLGKSTMLAVRAFYGSTGYSLPVMPGGTPKHPNLVVPQAEVVFIPRLPSIVLKSSLVLGQSVTNPALVLAEGRLRAKVSLTAAQRALVRAGDPATLYITDSDGGTTARAARVRAIQGSGSKTVAVLNPHRRLGVALMGAHVAANIVIASTRTAVLAVPVAAVYTSANGQTLVTVTASGRRVNIPVRVGADIGGYVPVTPMRGKLSAGDQVLVGQ